MLKRSIGATVSVDSNTQNINLFRVKHLMLINDGSDEVYVVLNQDTTSFNTVTTSNFQLRAGESMVLDTENGQGFIQMNITCNTAETASMRYLGWY